MKINENESQGFGKNHILDKLLAGLMEKWKKKEIPSIGNERGYIIYYTSYVCLKNIKNNFM